MKLRKRPAAVLALAVGVGAVLATAGAASAPGTSLWSARYKGTTSSSVDLARAVATTPTGGKVFVTGESAASGGYDYATVAYAGGTGAKLWAARYNGPGNDEDKPVGIVVSPNGSRVFVTGASWGGSTGARYEYGTIAYSAATGAKLWAKRFNSIADEYATSIAVSPDGTKVFVSGQGTGTTEATGDYDYLTVAYDAVTGAQLWAARYQGQAKSGDWVYALAVSPDSAKVFVTGYSWGSDQDYATVAYNASTGAKLWLARYTKSPTSQDLATALAVAPDGSKVYVTGLSEGANPNVRDYTTLAYNSATGAKLWIKRYKGTGQDNIPYEIAASPDGSKVVVTGTSVSASGGWDYATVAYGSASGAQLWASRYNGPGNGTDTAESLAITPDSGKVYVTGGIYAAGTDSDWGTAAYDAQTGSQLWFSNYDGPGLSNEYAQALAVSPTGSRVFVTGYESGAPGYNFLTIAYQG